MSVRTLAAGLLPLAAAVLIVCPALAAERPAIEPRVEKILKAAGDYLKEAREFTVHGEITIDDALETGQRIQYAASWDWALMRPNRLRTVTRGDRLNSRSWYDGTSFTMLDTDRNFYASWKAPSQTDLLLDRLPEELGITIPLSTLLYSDPYRMMRKDIRTASYAGLHLVNRIPCHHLVMGQEDTDVQVWIEESPQLVVRKVVVTYKKVPGAPQLTALLSDWNFSPRLSDLLFSFVPPEGADRIEFLRRQD